jgi:hypothetical protein
MEAHRERLVTKKVDLLKALRLDVAERIRLIPPVREHVERDLAADRKGKAVVGELGPQLLHKLRTDLVDLRPPASVRALTKGGGRARPCRMRRSRYARRCCDLSQLPNGVVKDWTNVAFLPMGVMLTMPFRNSMNVPLSCQLVSAMYPDAAMSCARTA